MEPPAQKQQYHVVCRDCLVERLLDDPSEATALKRDHADESDHHVVVAHVA